MQKKPDPFSMQDALRLANSPAGQQLLDRLRQADPEAFKKAQDQISTGNYSQIAKTLAPLLASEDIKKMMQKLGE